MRDNELKKMTVTIAGRDYPVRVKESEVEMVTWVVHEINQKLQDLQLKYNKNDLQDCLSMTILTYAVDYHQKTDSSYDREKVSDELNRIDGILDTMLDS